MLTSEKVSKVVFFPRGGGVRKCEGINEDEVGQINFHVHVGIRLGT